MSSKTQYKLGVLCKRGHDHEGTGQSLRYLNNNKIKGCVECERLKAKEYKKLHKKPKNLPLHVIEKRSKTTMALLINHQQVIEQVSLTLRQSPDSKELRQFDLQLENLKVGTYYFGEVCKREHDWLGLGKSVRNMARSECIECSRVISMKGYYANHEQNKARARERHELHKDLRNAVRSSKYYSDEAFRLRQKERSRVHFEKHREKFLKQLSDYNKAHPETKRARDTRRKARMRNAKLDSKFYGTYQLSHRFSQQNGQCLYCERQMIFGSPKCTVDHVVAVSKGGKDDMTNIVLACAVCNQSKNSHPLDFWLRRKGYYTEAKLRSIKEILEN